MNRAHFSITEAPRASWQETDGDPVRLNLYDVEAIDINDPTHRQVVDLVLHFGSWASALDTIDRLRDAILDSPYPALPTVEARALFTVHDTGLIEAEF